MVGREFSELREKKCSYCGRALYAMEDMIQCGTCGVRWDGEGVPKWTFEQSEDDPATRPWIKVPEGRLLVVENEVDR